MPDPSRRDFLSGRAAQQALQQQRDQFADAVVDAGEATPAPQGGDTVRLETRAMGCLWSVIMNPGQPRDVMAASDAFALVHRCEDQLTVYRDDSDIARVNRHAAETPQTVAPDLFAFLQTCRQLSQLTDGAFDPAMGALIQLWKASRAAGRIPTEVEIDAARACTGMQHVRLAEEQGTVAFDTPGVLFDFGAIGKGYAVDQAAGHLHREGVEASLVHGGQSSLFARGEHGGHAGWPVGLKNPLFTESRYATVLLRDEGMATSGSNIQYFRYRGQRYGHILDARTGWPAGDLLSVTVMAATATAADALSTAFYVMGREAALSYCDQHPEVAAILVPPPQRGKTLEPIVRNFPADRLFLEGASSV